MSTYRERFPSVFESAAKARRAVGVFAGSCGFGASEISDIVLAIGEACNNAVEHGHVENGEFIVDCLFEGGALHMEIVDTGRGFDETATFAGPDPSECIGRGRGFTIMRALMDSVACRRTASGMTVVLEKSLLAGGVAKAIGELGGFDAGSRGQPR
jgi:anti-sigma regulatory factor (Ser/Thr protein kinase)